MPGELGDTEEGIEGATPSCRVKEFVRVGWAPLCTHLSLTEV